MLACYQLAFAAGLVTGGRLGDIWLVIFRVPQRRVRVRKSWRWSVKWYGSTGWGPEVAKVVQDTMTVTSRDHFSKSLGTSLYYEITD